MLCNTPARNGANRGPFSIFGQNQQLRQSFCGLMARSYVRLRRIDAVAAQRQRFGANNPFSSDRFLLQTAENIGG